MARKYTFRDVKRGDHFVFTVTCTRRNAAGVAVPVDVSALQSAWCTGKLNENDADAAALFQRTYTNGGITVEDGPAGKLRVTIPNIGASLSYGGEIVFDVQIVEADGTVSTPAEGVIVVEPDVTRSS